MRKLLQICLSSIFAIKMNRRKYNKLETTPLKIEIERLAVLSDYCLQHLGQPWDAHTDRRTNGQGKNLMTR